MMIALGGERFEEGDPDFVLVTKGDGAEQYAHTDDTLQLAGEVFMQEYLDSIELVTIGNTVYRRIDGNACSWGDEDDLRYVGDEDVWLSAEDVIPVENGDGTQFNHRRLGEGDTYEWSHFHHCYVSVVSGYFDFVESQDDWIHEEDWRSCEFCGEGFVPDNSESPYRCDSCNGDYEDTATHHVIFDYGEGNGPLEYQHRMDLTTPASKPELSIGYTIGFEVEKSSVEGCSCEGSYVEKQPLFCTWETDSSCGVEGKTNVYDLHAQEELFMAHVSRSTHVDEPVNGRCGGHVTIAGPKMTFEHIRPYVGMVYALYRFRLNNTYSSNDKKLESGVCSYPAIRVRQMGMLEFRLVARVKHRIQLKWRFRFFSEFAKAVHEEMAWGKYLTQTKPLLMEAYGDEHRVEEIIEYARIFRRWLMSKSLGNAERNKVGEFLDLRTPPDNIIEDEQHDV